MRSINRRVVAADINTDRQRGAWHLLWRYYQEYLIVSGLLTHNINHLHPIHLLQHK